MTAHLTVTGPAGSAATVTISYDDLAAHAVATITGSSGGRAIVATMPAG